eukprot:g8990.t1
MVKIGRRHKKAKVLVQNTDERNWVRNTKQQKNSTPQTNDTTPQTKRKLSLQYSHGHTRKCREFMYIYWRGVDAHRLRTVRKKYKSHRGASRLLQPVMMSSDLVFEDSR